MFKRAFKLFPVLLAFCIAAGPIPVPTLAAGGQTHTVPDLGDVLELIQSDAVSDGDTIHLEGSGFVITNTEAPWVIDKSVTFEGGALQVGVSGILLDADVTFRNVALSFNKPARNAIMVNGHTLTLDSTSCANSSFNLFGGGLINSNNEPFTLPAPGDHSVITILGKTTLQGRDEYGKGNIYAGNLCMGGMTEENNGPDANGPANVFDGDVVIDIQGNVDNGALGTVYACGAQQRIPVGAASGKQTTPNAEKYTVSGSVTVQGALPNIEGAGSAETCAVYRDVSGNNYLTSRTFLDISSLSVESGHLCPEAETRLRGEKALSLSNGAQLDLSQFAGIPSLDVGSFHGEGFLILAPDQTCNITGSVTGSTKVVIGGLNADKTASSSLPLAGHTYLQAPSSQADSFILLPHNSRPGMTLVRDSNGLWTASADPSGEEALIAAFRFVNKTASVAPGAEAEFEMEPTLANGYVTYLDSIPLTVTVNLNTLLRPGEDPEGYYDYIYSDTLGDFSAYVADNTFCITAAEPGVYTIQITLPTEKTAGDIPLTDTATLTVSDGTSEPDPGPGPSHTHAWDSKWASDPTHHWHDCTAQDCNVEDNSLKDSYAPHTPGDWITDTSATATQAGSRHKECTVCAYVTAREDIPATGSGSGSGSGGGGTGGGNTGGGGSGSGSGGGGGSTPTEPVKPEETVPTPPVPEIPAKEFSDVQGHWAKEAIERVVSQKLFSGTGDTTFSPDVPMTRGMLMTVLARLDGADPESGAVWYEGGMKWAADNSISDGSAPEGLVTREQLVTMLYRYAATAGLDNIVNGTEILRFADTGDVADWAKEAMTWGVSTGLLRGTSEDTLSPQKTATRAEVAAILDRFVALLT